MNNKRNSNSRAAKIAAVIIMLVAVVIYIYYNNPTVAASVENEFAETSTKLSFAYEDKTNAYSYGGKGFYICTKDGMNFITSENEIKWAESFSISMKDPVFKGEGQYTAVCDASSSTLYMFSPDGLCFKKTLDNKILTFAISKGGYAAVICKDENGYFIQSFNKNGENIDGGYYHREDNVFPLAIDISNDGRILALSFLDITGTQMVSRIMLQYINSQERQSIENGIFFRMNKDGELVASLFFMDDNQLIMLSDSSLACIRAEANDGGRPGEKWNAVFQNRIDAFAVNNGKTIAIAYGETLPGREGKPVGLVALYNMEFYELGSYEFDTQVTYLNAVNDIMIAGAGRSFAAFNGRANVLWEHTVTTDVKALLTLENSNTVLLLDQLSAQVMKRGKHSNK